MPDMNSMSDSHVGEVGLGYKSPYMYLLREPSKRDLESADSDPPFTCMVCHLSCMCVVKGAGTKQIRSSRTSTFEFGLGTTAARKADQALRTASTRLPQASHTGNVWVIRCSTDNISPKLFILKGT
jgi:hypothetical protein